MSGNEKIIVDFEGIGAIFKGKRLTVPAYQRSYSWKTENVSSLLDDLRNAISDDVNEYFLGSIVLANKRDDSIEVVDGQQRLASTAIVIAAIRDALESLGDKQGADDVQSDFLGKRPRRGGEPEPFLTLNETDNPVYQRLIVSREKPIDLSANTHLIALARKAVEAYLRDQVLKKKTDTTLLHDWLEFLENKAKVIVVRVPENSDAFVIFEALNDRGLDLAISDLVKNFLFGKAHPNIEETKTRWLSTVTLLEQLSEDSPIVTFLRHFASSRYGHVRERDLFKAIKSNITTRKAAAEFSESLLYSAKTYVGFLQPEHELWSTCKPETKTSFECLKVIGAKQVRALLLAVRDKFGGADFEKAVRRIESVVMRNSIVGVSSGSQEKIYADAAKAVRSGQITNAKALSTALRPPTDTKFKSAFSTLTVSKTPFAKFLLRELEKQHLSNTNTTEPEKSPQIVNLEHVLPQRPTAGWIKLFTNAESASEYYKRLGNLALLSSKKNSSIGNADFATKKKTLSESSFALTSTIADSLVWDAKAIDSRQGELARLAVKRWSIS
jgi:hypothetical protein